jgi:hypothetical protein
MTYLSGAAFSLRDEVIENRAFSDPRYPCERDDSKRWVSHCGFNGVHAFAKAGAGVEHRDSELLVCLDER